MDGDGARAAGPVRVRRGRAASRAADHGATAALLDAATDGETGVRVWAPGRQVAFGPRDAREGGYDRARAAAARRGYPAVERSVGGRAVAYTGETTLAFAVAVPTDDDRAGLAARYEGAVAAVEGALRALGADVRRGEPPDSFCPGDHSLRGPTGKLAGVAQRVRRGAALVSGCLLVDEADELAGVLSSVYGALGVPFDPGTVGSVAAAGGPADPDRVARAVERALVGDREATVERL